MASTMRKMMVTQITHKFREAAKITEVPIPKVGPSQILVKNKYLGINASDINFSAGRYDPTVKPPFACGFEALGEVVEAGEESGYQPRQPVAYMSNGAFADYMLLEGKQAFPVPGMDAQYVPLLVSGLTASIGLDEAGRLADGETVLVTAAAGGTGQLAVQWAKTRGCHVIGTCSTPEKVEFLKGIGCNRVINYNEEDVGKTLKAEYPQGVDVVYESVGGEMFDTCVNALATKGRLIIIGYIAGYQSDRGFPSARTATLPQKLLPKSASVSGFFLFNHVSSMKSYAKKLGMMIQEGTIKSVVDDGSRQTGVKFEGLEGVYDAIDYLYSKKSIGKIIVELPDSKDGSRL